MRDGERRGIVCAGNWIVDRVHTITGWPEQGDLAHILSETEGVGGGAANVASDLVSFGFADPIVPVGCIGDDRDGETVRAHCARFGLMDRHIVTCPGTATAHTLVMTEPGKTRTFFYHPGANDLFGPEHVDFETLAAEGYRYFYLGYLMLLGGLDRVGPDGRSPASHLLERAQAAGFVTCVDFVSSENPDFAHIVGSALPWCDYLIINEIEAGRASERTVRAPYRGLEPASLCAAAEDLLRRNVRRGVIVHAPEGAAWAEPEAETLFEPALPVDPADIASPVGAGDAFCAAVLFGIIAGWERSKCLTIGHRAAAACLKGATATDGVPRMEVLLEGI